jgi:hypothetical protein
MVAKVPLLEYKYPRYVGTLMKRTCLLLSLAAVLILAGCKSGTAGRVVSVSVSPNGLNVVVGTTLQMTATVMETSNTAVTWTVVGGSANGTISGSGLYTAPATVPAPAQVTIMAISQRDPTKSGSATVTVTTTAGPSNITVVVAPAAASIVNYGTQQFTATVTGSTNTRVTWQVNGATGGSQTVGFISAAGFYVAPGNVPTTSDGMGGSIATTLTVTAVSQADLTASGSSSVTIQPGNQSRETGPIELGTSGGNGNDAISNSSNHTITCCGGTLGSLVTRGGIQYILGNNHVLARRDTAAVGDPIVQPGLIDAGLTPQTKCDKTQATTVATLSQFVNLETEDQAASSANIDAAIAQVLPGLVDATGNILYLGAAADSNGVPLPGAPNAGSGVIASISLPVAKSGRTTGLTCSTVLAVNTNTSVEYHKSCDNTGTTFTVNYDNQVDVAGGGFGAEGDSGSLIVSQSTADPVALLYAGSDMDTVGNPVGQVLNFFANGGNAVTFVGGTAHSVIGCTLPTAPQSAAKTVQTGSVTAENIQRALAARDAQAPALLAYPEVQAVGVGASLDSSAEPAIVFFVTKGQSRSNIPAQVDGIRTRIVEGQLFGRRGAISATETSVNEQGVASPQLVYSLTDAELQRARVVHAAHAKALMQQTGVQGVGITSSVDSPGEAALMIFLIRGAAHGPIPPVMDGLRTRVRESSRFRAGNRGIEPQRACMMPARRSAR